MSHADDSRRYNKKMRDTYPEWEAWRSMKQRCGNPKHKWFEYYGGKGIKVCDRWGARCVGFFNFLRDMGPRPKPEYDCDRKDASKDYCPENCRWLHRSENRAVNRKKETEDDVPF